jgi:hypothetical protein
MEVKKNKCFDVIYSATTKCGSHSPPHAIRATGWLPVALVAHRNLSNARLAKRGFNAGELQFNSINNALVNHPFGSLQRNVSQLRMELGQVYTLSLDCTDVVRGRQSFSADIGSSGNAGDEVRIAWGKGLYYDDFILLLFDGAGTSPRLRASG